MKEDLEELQFQISEKRKNGFTGSSQEAFDRSVKHAKERIIDAIKICNSLSNRKAKKRIYS